MKLNYKILTGISLATYGILSLLSNGIINLHNKVIIGITLIIYALPSIYISLNLSKRNMIVVSSIAFFVGIIFLLDNSYKIYSQTTLIFLLTFIVGSIFFLLFIDNPEEKYLLITSIFLFIISYPAVKLFEYINDSLFFYYYNRIENIISPVILLLIAVNIFIKRND
ncbi:hypothetical protein [Rosettibacter firmus]|uniref:hypothetical protein n=1 Tax=Rosettibacter firmus TaxID=3111522 RepID=UPI00336BC2EF